MLHPKERQWLPSLRSLKIATKGTCFAIFHQSETWDKTKKSPMVSPHTSAKSSAGQTTCQFKGRIHHSIWINSWNMPQQGQGLEKQLNGACLFISKARSFFGAAMILDGWTLCRIGPLPTTITCCLHVTQYHPLPYIWCLKRLVEKQTLKKMRIHMRHLEPNWGSRCSASLRPS